ncbi:MAG: penicillin-binding protein 1C [Bacteroidales bacterium]|nr:penicillin-binding protein 1C [Bacteroidales bacterium]
MKIILIIAGVIIIPVLLSPLPRFSSPLSTVVEAADGTLLGARIAEDGQWRFPGGYEVPEKFEKALLTFEDRYFYLHPGINPVSVARALITNIKAGKILSGGSTITMQLARLSSGNISRSYSAKMGEMLSALKLELFRSKKRILAIYAANAPFGGNTVGLDAAAWRYLGKPPPDMSWAEAAALAVLPNSPALVHPGRNLDILRTKRDELLGKLYRRNCFDSLTLILSLDEPLPGEPRALPSQAPHLTDYFFKHNRGEKIRTTIDPVLQDRANSVIRTHQKELSGNLIHNSACIIVKVETGEVMAYVGNSSAESPGQHGNDVDIIRSPRSTGSILKPLLYAGMQQSGDILPNSLVPDIPSRFQGFSPKNFDLSYSGAVPASLALSQSLNIPSVRMLQQYSPEKMLALLRKTGFTSFNRPASHYGLSLILGGGETSLWELAGVYSSLSRVLNRYNREGNYSDADYHMPVLTPVPASMSTFRPVPLSEPVPATIPASVTTSRKASVPTSRPAPVSAFRPVPAPESIPATRTVAVPAGENRKSKREPSASAPVLSASSIWLTYEALRKVNRPEGESGWQFFSSSGTLAWKTGTSFGFRDAWALGTTPGYVIAVWAGNADGEGRPGLTGIGAAAPILFDLAGIMGSKEWFSEQKEWSPEPNEWFSEPSDEMTLIPVCSQSGFRAGPDCPETMEIMACVNGLRSEACPYHRIIHLDESGTMQVNSDCAPASSIRNESWFILPPAMEYFYRRTHPGYKTLPPFAPGCLPGRDIPAMEFIYPTPGIKIFIPRDQTGEMTRIISEVAHRNPSKKIFWHLDDKFQTSTRSIHQVEILAGAGNHSLTAVDEEGNTIQCSFSITGR